MPRSHSLLDTVRIASPCSVSWESMAGDDRARFCHHCDLHVFNLSAMNQEEAEDLIRQKQGRLCARYYLRADGKVMTADCPELADDRRQRRVTTVVGLVLAMLIGLLFWLQANAGPEPEESWLRRYEPFRTILSISRLVHHAASRRQVQRR